MGLRKHARAPALLHCTTGILVRGAYSRARRARLYEVALPDHPHVLELPGIALVDVLREQSLALVQRRPLGVLADYRAEIRHADLEVAPEIHLVGLDDAEIRILHGPDHPGEHRHAHLQARGVVVGGELAGLENRELRAVPVGVFLVSREQHAELVDPAADVVHQDALALLLHIIATDQLVDRYDGRIARVIRVVNGGAIRHLRAFAHREVIGDGDRLPVRDAEAVEVPGPRRPGAHAGARPWLRQVNRRHTAEVMALAVTRKVALVRAPAHLGWL